MSKVDDILSGKVNPIDILGVAPAKPAPEAKPTVVVTPVIEVVKEAKPAHVNYEALAKDLAKKAAKIETMKNDDIRALIKTAGALGHQMFLEVAARSAVCQTKDFIEASNILVQVYIDIETWTILTMKSSQKAGSKDA